MKPIIKRGCKMAAKFLTFKLGKNLYKNGGIIGGAVAGIIALGILASGIRKKRNRNTIKLPKKIVI